MQEKITTGRFADALRDIDALLDEQSQQSTQHETRQSAQQHPQQDAQQTAQQNPQHRDLLYMAAVCHRHTGQHDKAQEHLDALKPLPGDKGRVYQEQGHLHIAQNRPQPALAAYANACQLNPALVASWQAQCRILTALHREGEARQVEAQLQRLQALPKALVAATDLLAQGKLTKAETLCRKFLKANPTHVEGMRLLANIATQFGVLEDAEFLLESAAAFEPDNTRVAIDHIAALRRRHKFAEALAAARKLHEGQPDNPQLQSLYAIEKVQTGDYDGAIALFDRVLQSLPADAATLTSRGHALKTCGKQAEAIQSYRAAIASNPLHGDAWHALSNLKTYRFDEADIDNMLAREQREELSPHSGAHFAFALGKAFEDAGDHARSFEFYAKGNRLKRQQSNYSADKMAEELLAQRRFFSREVLAGRAGAGCAAPDPIFIVGLPRAGSTLLEQILSSHSQVDGTMELPNILSIAHKLKRQGREDGTPYPDRLANLDDAQLRELGEQYLEETRAHRQGAPFFIDKMPNNFRHIGLIKMILPAAKIIDARRQPMACCFSGFKQLFAEGQEFTYDLEDIGRYYKDYVALMAHWDTVAPGSVLRVRHEDVVADLEGQVRRMLAFCQLPFEEACLRFFETERAVRTASSEQVRQPIYDSGVEQWVNYQPFLGVLEGALEGRTARSNL